ncbi:hypothetical protein OBBRIDRAFT_229427 [Obba rivulosa]|uniref:Uncharacterized protein n=1 Tax=Obba rivulosa TaxID=1052685 RepID=A0A8E2J740_9APHY|nr:hypothetical protein OBBRIDRAFT_229427 [Obba rivulosa]
MLVRFRATRRRARLGSATSVRSCSTGPVCSSMGPRRRSLPLFLSLSLSSAGAALLLRPGSCPGPGALLSPVCGLIKSCGGARSSCSYVAPKNRLRQSTVNRSRSCILSRDRLARRTPSAVARRHALRSECLNSPHKTLHQCLVPPGVLRLVKSPRYAIAPQYVHKKYSAQMPMYSLAGASGSVRHRPRKRCHRHHSLGQGRAWPCAHARLRYPLSPLVARAAFVRRVRANPLFTQGLGSRCVRLWPEVEAGTGARGSIAIGEARTL